MVCFWNQLSIVPGGKSGDADAPACGVPRVQADLPVAPDICVIVQSVFQSVIDLFEDGLVSSVQAPVPPPSGLFPPGCLPGTSEW